MPIRNPPAANAVNFVLRQITIPAANAVDFALGDPAGVVLDPEEGTTDGAAEFTGEVTSGVSNLYLITDTDDASGIVVGRTTYYPGR